MNVEQVKKNEIAVSVIVPAYNAEGTLVSTVDSLLAQTLRDIEIIIVNDGSTDATPDIIRKYERENPGKVIGIHKTNAGVSAARNAGIDVARGEYIGFCDADDRMRETMLETLYHCAVEEGSDVVQCGHIEIYPDGHTREVLPDREHFAKTILETKRVFGYSIFIWDKIYRNSIIKEYNIRLDEKILYAEEMSFMLQVFLHCKRISAVRYGLYVYSARRAGAASTCFDERLLHNAAGIAKVCDIAIDFGVFTVLENAILHYAKGCFFRRVNDFFLYDNKELQKKIADGFFDLFDSYFWNWKGRIVSFSILKRVFSRDYLKYIDRKRMHQYINSSHAYKKTEKRYQKFREKCKNTFKTIRTMYLEHRNAMRYAKYRNYPVDPNVVMLSANSGSLFGDSICYMTKALLEMESKLQVYVVTNNIKRDFIISLTGRIRPHFVESHSKEHIKLLATAKYLVSNTKLPTFFIKKPGQVYMNTWHGTPLKTLGKGMRLGKRDMGLNQKEFFTADYLLYPNEHTMKNMMADFELDKFFRGKVLLSGYPRNSVFFNHEDYNHEMRKIFGLTGKKVYVYMPTWRGDSVESIDIGRYQKFLEQLLKEWDKKLDEDIVLFIKLHPYVMRKIKISSYNKIRAFPADYEIYLFLNMADGLITDYSSVFFDFANTRKEVLLFPYDKEEYMRGRGVYMDMDELPFPQFNDLSSLVEYMNQKRIFQPSAAYLEFVEKFCCYDDGNTAKTASQCLLTDDVEESRGKLIDYSGRKNENYDVVFMPSLSSEKNQRLFRRLADSADEKTIFVFFMDDVSRETDLVLNEVRNEKYSYIVVPGEMVTTMFEAILLVLYRKFHIGKKKAANIYANELNRILPNINIRSFTNYSNVRKFIDITNLLNKD